MSRDLNHPVHDTSSTTILVVDDEVGIRELLSEILTDEGYDVPLAENAEAARAFRALPERESGSAAASSLTFFVTASQVVNPWKARSRSHSLRGRVISPVSTTRSPGESSN